MKPEQALFKTEKELIGKKMELTMTVKGARIQPNGEAYLEFEELPHTVLLYHLTQGTKTA